MISTTIGRATLTHSGSGTGPFGDVLLRKSDWEAYQIQLEAYKHAEQADAEGKGNEQTKHVLEVRAYRSTTPLVRSFILF